jgi:hypothetical protein
MSKRCIDTHSMPIFEFRELSLPLPNSGSTSAQEGHMSSVTAVPVTPAVGAAWDERGRGYRPKVVA